MRLSGGSPTSAAAFAVERKVLGEGIAQEELQAGSLHRLPGVQHVQTCFSLQEFKGVVGGLPMPQDDAA